MSSSGIPSLDNIIRQTPEREPMEPPRVREMFCTGLLSFESSAIDNKETNNQSPSYPNNNGGEGTAETKVVLDSSHRSWLFCRHQLPGWLVWCHQP